MAVRVAVPMAVLVAAPLVVTVRRVVVMRMGPMMMVVMIMMVVIAVGVRMGHGPMSHRAAAGSIRRASHEGLGARGDRR